jgi:alginate O-acetyltransferase complex protein AlgI
MIFNSLEFLFFLPIVFALYWLLNNKRLVFQNALLLIASYYFYQCWDYRFLFLLVFSTLLDYVSGIKIEEATNIKNKKIWFWLSISINLGFLGVFKYYNFFAESFTDLLVGIGFKVDLWTLKVILPVGISFYTFHGLSYIIDIYNGRIKATRNFIDYSVFVSFFPLLVAGPIERATHLLPQIQKKRKFDFQLAADGMRQILWGLFKKMVIADNCATYVNDYFEHPGDVSGDKLMIGAIFFAFQIYGDFSGYSDIALGTAKLFGIRLLKNFAFPYFSRDISEFWRRWHISLSSWFRDYLYFPLGGSKLGKKRAIINTLIIFTVSGFWHGANWTFIAWGVANALLFIPLLVFDLNRINLDTIGENRRFPLFTDLLKMGITFFIVCLLWVLFRADNLNQAFQIYSGIFSKDVIWAPFWILYKKPFYFILVMLLFEWFNRSKEHGFQIDGIKSTALRWVAYLFILHFIFIYGAKSQEFIYFQF